MNLSELRPGTQATIVNFSGCPQGYRQRLLSLGLTPGACVTVIRVAPLGDPIQIQTRGFNLSLRKNEACGIEVEIVTHET